MNAGCGKQLNIGTDWIDAFPSSPKVKKVDLNKDRFPYKDNTFDVVYARAVLQALKNIDHFLSESHRVLKKGGSIYLITDSGKFHSLLTKVHEGRYNESHPDKLYHFFTKEHIEQWLKDAKFKNIHVKYDAIPPVLPKFSYKLHYRIETVTGLKPVIIAEAKK